MAFDYIRVLAVTRMEARSDSFLQSAVMDRLLKLPIDFFKNCAAGDLAQKVLAFTQIRMIVFSVIITKLKGFWMLLKLI